MFQAPIDPQQLLKALGELLGPTGAIQGTQEATRIARFVQTCVENLCKTQVIYSLVHILDFDMHYRSIFDMHYRSMKIMKIGI